MYGFLAAVIFIVVMALVKSIPVSDKKKEVKNNKTSDMKKDEIKVTNEGVQIEFGSTRFGDACVDTDRMPIYNRRG